MNDPYDNSTPKYQTSQDIYDALCEFEHMTEAEILSEMGFEDVSYEGQTYYYIDKGMELLEKFNEITEYGNKTYLLDLAIWQISGDEIHDLIMEALWNDDLAKRIGFKKIFIDTMLYGEKKDCEEIMEHYCDELRELGCKLHRIDMIQRFNAVMKARGTPIIANPYDNLANEVIKKCSNLRLQDEIKLIYDCRTLLFSYDDFIYGLRMNQELHNYLQTLYDKKFAALQSAYDEKVRQLMLIAQANGIALSDTAYSGLLTAT